jgi:acyl carrier protein
MIDKLFRRGSDGGPAGLRDRIRAFVDQSFYVAGAAPGDADSLLEAGIIDSTGVLEIIEFLQKEFGIRVEDEEIVAENLDSVERIAAFVDRKRA